MLSVKNNAFTQKISPFQLQRFAFDISKLLTGTSTHLWDHYSYTKQEDQKNFGRSRTKFWDQPEKEKLQYFKDIEVF